MPDRDAMIAAVKAHCRGVSEGTFDDWVKIWADDVVIEDPVGSPPYRGIEAVRTTFWTTAQNAAPRMTLKEDVLVCGNEAIAVMSVVVSHGGNEHTMSPVVDHFTFDDAGKIKSMRAFMNY